MQIYGTRQRDGEKEIDRQRNGVQYIMQLCQINHTAISYNNRSKRTNALTSSDSVP